MPPPLQRFEHKTIFISRSLSPDSPLHALKQHGHTLFAESLIKISPIRFTYTPRTDWIFFTSKNAIHHFFSQDPQLNPAVKYGVISSASAGFLKTYGKRADFIGVGVDVTSIAKNFAARIGNETVLLPQAIDSLQTIQKQLSFKNNCSKLFVYKTSLRHDFEIPVADVLVFTSPSNVQAYFEKYKLQPAQQVVAIGSTTLHKLKGYGVKEAALPGAFTEQAMLDVLVPLVNRED